MQAQAQRLAMTRTLAFNQILHCSGRMEPLLFRGKSSANDRRNKHQKRVGDGLVRRRQQRREEEARELDIPVHASLTSRDTDRLRSQKATVRHTREMERKKSPSNPLDRRSHPMPPPAARSITPHNHRQDSKAQRKQGSLSAESATSSTRRASVESASSLPTLSVRPALPAQVERSEYY